MFNSKLIKNRIKEVVNETALENKDYDFMSTHLPFKNLKYQMRGETDTTNAFVSEEDYFRNNILENRDEHLLVMVQGDSGAGKSHFIRWLYNNYKNHVDHNEDLAILIAREDNTLKSALKQIVSSDLFSDIDNNDEFKKMIEASNSLNKKEIEEQLLGLLTAIINSDESRTSKLNKRIKRNLYSFLTDEVIRSQILLKENGPVKRIASKLITEKEEVEYKFDAKFNPEDFNIKFGSNIIRQMSTGDSKSSQRALDLAERIANESNLKDIGIKKDISEYLNQYLDKAIQSIIKVDKDDLIEVFKDIRTKLKQNGKDLTLFIEDVTAFTGINKELIETLLISHKSNSELCRLISFVGVTTSYHDTSLPDNIRGRVSNRIIIDNNSLFEERKDIVELVAKYLNTINQDSNTIREWYLKGGDSENLPVTKVNMDKKWARYKMDNGETISLFPFNENSLARIYFNMENENRNPRKFLALIFRNLLPLYLNNNKNFPPSYENLRSIQIPDWEDSLYEGIIQGQHNGTVGKRLSTLIRIWGDGNLNVSKDKITNERLVGGLSQEVFKTFGMPMIEGISTNGSENEDFSIVENDIDNSESEVEEKKDKSRETYNKYLRELEDWRKGESLFSHKILRQDIVRLLLNFINWEREDISPLLLKQMVTLSNIHIQGQTVASSDGIILKRNEETFYFLLGIISWKHLGERSWDFKHNEQYILKVTNYLIKIKDRVLEMARTPKGILRDKWHYNEMLLLNSYYFRTINGDFCKPNMTKEEIFLKLVNRGINIGDKKYGKIWNSLIERVSREKEFKDNQDYLIMNNNLILGNSDPYTTKIFVMDSYKVLLDIQELIDQKWDIDCILPNIETNKSSVQLLPARLIKDYWVGKIDPLIDEEVSRLKLILDEVELNMGKDINLKSIEKVRVVSKRFLQEGLNSINKNFNQTKFMYLVENSITSEEILESYNKCKHLLEVDDQAKLILLSKIQNEHIKEFNIVLKELDKEVDKINAEINREMEVYNLDLIKDLENIRTSLVGNIEEIKLNVQKIIGGN